VVWTDAVSMISKSDLGFPDRKDYCPRGMELIKSIDVFAVRRETRLANLGAADLSTPAKAV
jgi:hypothetical protein